MTTIPSFVPMDPLSDLDYSMDWSQWLPTGDTISTSDWTVPADLHAYSESISGAATIVHLKAADGVTLLNGTRYTLVNSIVTAGGRTEDQAVTVLIKTD